MRDAGIGDLRHVVHCRHDAHRHVVVPAFRQRAVVQEPAVRPAVADDEFFVAVEPLCQTFFRGLTNDLA